MQVPSLNKEVNYVGDNAVLSGCQFTSNFTNSLSVSWLKDGNVIDSRATFTSVWNGNNAFLINVSSLTISNLKSSDNGDYACRLSYTNTKDEGVDSPPVKLLVSSKFGSYFLYICVWEVYIVF